MSIGLSRFAGIHRAIRQCIGLADRQKRNDVLGVVDADEIKSVTAAAGNFDVRCATRAT